MFTPHLIWTILAIVSMHLRTTVIKIKLGQVRRGYPVYVCVSQKNN